MEINLVSPADGADYIRHARCETLKAVGAELTPAAIEPSSFGWYLFAHERAAGRPIGMAEFAFHSQVYESYQDGPYGSLTDLNEFCPFAEMAGMRTVYVEPEFRGRRPIFLHLVLAAAMFCQSLGATYATVTTNADDEFLNGLYTKLGGRRIGTLPSDVDGDLAVSVFVFKIDDLVAHKATRHVRREFDLEAALEPCLV